MFCGISPAYHDCKSVHTQLLHQIFLYIDHLSIEHALSFFLLFFCKILCFFLFFYFIICLGNGKGKRLGKEGNGVLIYNSLYKGQKKRRIRLKASLYTYIYSTLITCTTNRYSCCIYTASLLGNDILQFTPTL